MLKRTLDKWLGLEPAAWLCGILAIGSVALAFPGAQRSTAFMNRPPLLALTVVLTAATAYTGLRAIRRRRFDSALLHAGCAIVMAGWLIGRWAVLASTEERPVTGSMAMIDGDESDRLWDGPYLTNAVGRVPFTVRLERFFVEHYPSTQADRDAGRMPPIREYRSRVTITEPDRPPYTVNILVNHPAYVKGYHIYQMSWGQGTDQMGRPIIYTVLQFIRDPGLPVVYTGFAILIAGLTLFAWRVVRAGQEAPK